MSLSHKPDVSSESVMSYLDTKSALIERTRGLVVPMGIVLHCREVDTDQEKIFLGDGVTEFKYEEAPYQYIKPDVDILANRTNQLEGRVAKLESTIVTIDELQTKAAAMQEEIIELKNTIKNLENKTKGMWYHVQEFFRYKK